MSADADRIGSATADLMANITDELHDISPRPVGYGGYSDVHTGVWRSTFGSMKVAIKVIRAAPRSRSTSDELPRVLRREISVWKRLLHPNIHFLCGFYEGFGSLPALVSPWYENGDINDYVRLHAADPDVGPMKLKLFADVVTGIQFLHEHHIVHGDIKGGNVLISSTGVARLCDFGLSRLLLELSQSTTSTGGKGTMRWMAPELLLVDGARHSYASDIWACGCLFIEVWSNVLPYYDKANNHQVLLALSRHEPPARPDDMSDLMWSLVQACCVSEAAERASPSSLLRMINVSLVSRTMEPVRKMVQLNDLPNVVETKLLAEIATSMAVPAKEGRFYIDMNLKVEDGLVPYTLSPSGESDPSRPKLPRERDHRVFFADDAPAAAQGAAEPEAPPPAADSGLVELGSAVTRAGFSVAALLASLNRVNHNADVDSEAVPPTYAGSLAEP